MTISNQLVVRSINDKAMIINLKNGQVTVIDEIGELFWQSIVTDQKDEVFKKIISEYDVSLEVLEEDYKEFINKMRELEIVW